MKAGNLCKTLPRIESGFPLFFMFPRTKYRRLCLQWNQTILMRIAVGWNSVTFDDEPSFVIGSDENRYKWSQNTGPIFTLLSNDIAPEHYYTFARYIS
ncbi:hypothetical protein TNIN_184641 [Trichonephila inaurata madagascariensis]|uniref:Uncharacterized protein n=1 Tax=Trichonephila inaurata madagascariensis TaxID=2747483 RepID=A0A8X6YNX4_9ARAC|nr:hypothetical protein TNIN_184641 [Trichonephila inaurata madagascariensis]